MSIRASAARRRASEPITRPEDGAGLVAWIHVNDPQEIGRILRSMADQIEQLPSYSMYRTALDSNGKDVGRYRFRSR